MPLITPWRNILAERIIRNFTRIRKTPFKLKDQWLVMEDEPHSKTLGIVYHELASGFYEPPTPIKPGDRVLDIGAHVGFWTIINALRNPKAVFLAVEPNPLNYHNLLKNISRAGLKNVIALNTGLGKPGLIQSLHNDSNTGASYTTKKIVKAGKHLWYYYTHDGVPAMMLSQYVNILGGHVDLLKMDCEGAEHEGIDSLKHINSIIAEIHLKKDGQDGFEMFHIIDREIPNNRLTYQPTGIASSKGLLWISPGAKNFP